MHDIEPSPLGNGAIEQAERRGESTEDLDL